VPTYVELSNIKVITGLAAWLVVLDAELPLFTVGSTLEPYELISNDGVGWDPSSIEDGPIVVSDGEVNSRSSDDSLPTRESRVDDTITIETMCFVVDARKE